LKKLISLALVLNLYGAFPGLVLQRVQDHNGAKKGVLWRLMLALLTSTAGHNQNKLQHGF